MCPCCQQLEGKERLRLRLLGSFLGIGPTKASPMVGETSGNISQTRACRKLIVLSDSQISDVMLSLGRSHDEVHVIRPCLVEVALLRALVVRPEPCVVRRQKAAVVLAVPAWLLQAEHLLTAALISPCQPHCSSFCSRFVRDYQGFIPLLQVLIVM